MELGTIQNETLELGTIQFFGIGIRQAPQANERCLNATCMHRRFRFGSFSAGQFVHGQNFWERANRS